MDSAEHFERLSALEASAGLDEGKRAIETEEAHAHTVTETTDNAEINKVAAETDTKIESMNNEKGDEGEGDSQKLEKENETEDNEEADFEEIKPKSIREQIPTGTTSANAIVIFSFIALFAAIFSSAFFYNARNEYTWQDYNRWSAMNWCRTVSVSFGLMFKDKSGNRY